jgi:hypothetical protein
VRHELLKKVSHTRNHSTNIIVPGQLGTEDFGIPSQYHWTDHKVKVHTFICVIALLLSQVLWKKACDLGFKTSINRLIDDLSAVRRVEIYDGHRHERPTSERGTVRRDGAGTAKTLRRTDRTKGLVYTSHIARLASFTGVMPN